MLELAADAILLIHFLFVLFIVGGLALTWIGAWHGWLWVRSIAFRLAPDLVRTVGTVFENLCLVQAFNETIGATSTPHNAVLLAPLDCRHQIGCAFAAGPECD